LAISVAVELLGDVQAQLRHIKSWLVQKFDSDNNILILSLGVLLRDGLEYLQSLLHSIASLPLGVVHSLSRIVISILAIMLVAFERGLSSFRPYLGAWSTVEINNDLQTQTSCPVHSGIDVDVRAGDIRRAERIVSPVTDWDTHHVEAGLLDLVEVLPSHKSIPMLAKDTESCVVAKRLSKRVFVDNVLLWSVGVCIVKDRRCDPSKGTILAPVVSCRACYEVTHGSSTSHPPILTPLIFSEPHRKSTPRFSLYNVSETGRNVHSYPRCRNDRTRDHGPAQNSKPHSPW
jgi:hypothetical protein